MRVLRWARLSPSPGPRVLRVNRLRPACRRPERAMSRPVCAVAAAWRLRLSAPVPPSSQVLHPLQVRWPALHHRWPAGSRRPASFGAGGAGAKLPPRRTPAPVLGWTALSQPLCGSRWRRLRLPHRAHRRRCERQRAKPQSRCSRFRPADVSASASSARRSCRPHTPGVGTSSSATPNWPRTGSAYPSSRAPPQSPPRVPEEPIAWSYGSRRL